MVELELLIAGHCVQREALVRRGGSWRTIEFPSLVAVLRHPDAGVILYDAGYAPRFHAATQRWPYSIYANLLPVTCGADDTAVTQLAHRGIVADQVRTIVFSHLHGDHIGGLLDFPDAAIVTGDVELPDDWRTASPWHNLAHGFVPALLHDDIDDRLVPLSAFPVVPTGLGGRLRNGYDLTGDTSVVAIPVPGHTPGHLGLWIPGSGPAGVFLVGDAAWSQRAFTHGELPPTSMLAMMHDRDGYREAIGELARLHRRRPDTLIVPTHCSVGLAEARSVLNG